MFIWLKPYNQLIQFHNQLAEVVYLIVTFQAMFFYKIGLETIPTVKCYFVFLPLNYKSKSSIKNMYIAAFKFYL